MEECVIIVSSVSALCPLIISVVSFWKHLPWPSVCVLYNAPLSAEVQFTQMVFSTLFFRNGTWLAIKLSTTQYKWDADGTHLVLIHWLPSTGSLSFFTILVVCVISVTCYCMEELRPLFSWETTHRMLLGKWIFIIHSVICCRGPSDIVFVFKR